MARKIKFRIVDGAIVVDDENPDDSRVARLQYNRLYLYHVSRKRIETRDLLEGQNDG